MDFTQAKRNKKLDRWVLIILLCSLCLGMNYLVSKLNWKIDLSEKSEYSLSQESLALLNKLHSPVDIIVTIRENSELPKITLRFLHDLNLLLESIIFFVFNTSKSQACKTKGSCEMAEIFSTHWDNHKTDLAISKT